MAVQLGTGFLPEQRGTMATTSGNRATVAVRSNQRVSRAFYSCIQAAAVKALSEQVSEPLKSRLSQRAEDTISAVAESFGASPPSPIVPNPWPIPSASALTLATQLTLYANTVQPGVMQDTLQKAAGRLVEASYSVRGDKPMG